MSSFVCYLGPNQASSPVPPQTLKGSYPFHRSPPFGRGRSRHTRLPPFAAGAVPEIPQQMNEANSSIVFELLERPFLEMLPDQADERFPLSLPARVIATLPLFSCVFLPL